MSKPKNSDYPINKTKVLRHVYTHIGYSAPMSKCAFPYAYPHNDQYTTAPSRREHLRDLLVRNDNLLHGVLLPLEVVKVKVRVARQEDFYAAVSYSPTMPCMGES